MRAIISLSFAVLIAACTQFPELDATITPEMERADFPRLAPVEPLLAQAENNQISQATSDAIAARVARLRARAARLRGSIVDNGTRARMRQGVTGPVS